MEKMKLMGLLDDAISAVWAEYQTAEGISDGDCPPLTMIEYDALVEKIADLIIKNEEAKK